MAFHEGNLALLFSISRDEVARMFAAKLESCAVVRAVLVEVRDEQKHERMRKPFEAAITVIDELVESAVFLRDHMLADDVWPDGTLKPRVWEMSAAQLLELRAQLRPLVKDSADKLKAELRLTPDAVDKIAALVHRFDWKGIRT
jgi:hypothetical protein